MRTKLIITVLITIIRVSLPCFAQTEEKVQARDKADSTVQQIIIKHSGFLKDDELIIQFRKDDHEIIKVVDEGKIVADEEFYKYESMLHNYLQFRSLEEIVPRIKRLKRDIRRRAAHLAPLRIREMVQLELKLDSLRLNLIAPRERIARQLSESVLQTQRDMLEIKARLKLEQTEIQQTIQKLIKELLQEGIIPSKEDVTIKTKKGKCWVNGRRLSDEEIEKLKEIWNSTMDIPFNESSRTIVL
jgi:tyrosyl-tRNA synthetase